MKRVPFLLAMLGLLSLTIAGPVMAAAPGNDTYATRTVIAGLPFTDSVDTTEATTDADDLDIASYCGAPALDASVWYEITPTSDAGLLVDASGTDYSVGLIVASGTPSAFDLLACDAYAVSFAATAGVTYTILAFDYQGDGGGNGGQLALSVTELPPPPTLDATISSTGSVNAKTGLATIRGTVTCSGGEDYGKNFMYVGLTQNVGRFRITGDGFVEFTCDGTTQPWVAQVTGYNGKFAGGKATGSLYAVACGVGGCTEVSIPSVSITLRK